MKNKKNLGYILIGLGALDLIIWISNGFSSGYLEYIVGVNFLSQYGAWIMIASGFYFLRMEKGKEAAEVDLVTDLEDGENVIYKNVGTATIIILTNKKIIFRIFEDISVVAKNHNNVVIDTKSIFLFSDIASARAVKSKETAKNTLGGLINTIHCVQLVMKDGTIHNLSMSSNCELISAHINKNITR